MWEPKADKYESLRSATGWILAHPDLDDELTPMELLVSPLEFLGNGRKDHDFAVPRTDIIARAFAPQEHLMIGGEGLFDYADAFEGSGVEVVLDNNYHHQFLLRKDRGHKEGRDVTIQEVGRFTKSSRREQKWTLENIGEAGTTIKDVHRITQEPDIRSPTDFAFYKWLDDQVPTRLRDELAQTLKEIKQEQVINQQKYAKKKAKNRRRANSRRGGSKSKGGGQEEGAGAAAVNNPLSGSEEDVPVDNATAAPDLLEHISRGEGNENDLPMEPPEFTTAGEGVPGVNGGRAKRRAKRPHSANSRPRTPFQRILSNVRSAINSIPRPATPSTKKRKKKLSPAQEYAELMETIPQLVKRLEVVRNTTGVELEVKKKKTLHYIIDGRAGSIVVDKDAYFNVNDLVEQLPPLPAKYDNDESEALRQKRAMRKAQYGANQFHIPTGVEIVSKDRMTRLRQAALLKKRLDDLFDGERCHLNRDAMIILSAFGLHNYGGSDEALEQAIAGSWAALFEHIEYEVDPAKVRISMHSV